MRWRRRSRLPRTRPRAAPDRARWRRRHRTRRAPRRRRVRWRTPCAASLGPRPLRPRARTSCAPQSQHPLGGDVALDLVRARVDGSGEGELVALLPGRIEIEIGANEIEGDLVQLDVELTPPDLVDAGLCARLRTIDEPRDRFEGEQLVR